MIVKKLRKKRSWSQEQLATLCGVSLRTIQRVEAGNKASLETLKALASVFEVDISKLTDKITVIDKESDEWKSEPKWVKLFLFGIKKRSHSVAIEYLLLASGFAHWYFSSQRTDTCVIFLCAYINAKLLAYIDSKGYW